MTESKARDTGPGRWERRYVAGDLPWDTGRPDVHLQRFLEAFHISPCRTLVVGCGTGTNAIWLDSLGFDVVGVDLSPTAVQQAQEKASLAGAGCTLVAADFLSDPIPGPPFSLVYDRACFHVFDAAEDRARFAERAAELLQPAGLWLSLLGSTDGPARESGPPRRSALDVAVAVEPHFEILDLRSTSFDEGLLSEARAWVLFARRR